MNAWSSWSACSPNNGKCGAGTQYQTRTVATQPYCSPACPATRQTRSCTHSCCPRDCAVSSWGSWSACSNTCGTGESYEGFLKLISPDHDEDLYLDITVACEWALPYGFKGRSKWSEEEMLKGCSFAISLTI